MRKSRSVRGARSASSPRARSRGPMPSPIWSRWPARRSCIPSCTETTGPAARATGPLSVSALRGRWCRQRADLSEERHQVEVVFGLGDLVSLERHDLDRWDLHLFVSGRDRAHRALELTGVRTLPDDLENDSVATLDGLRDRPFGIRERFPPAFAELDDRIRPLDTTLGRELLVNRIRAERSLEARPVTFAESFYVLLCELNLVCHYVPPLSLER